MKKAILSGMLMFQILPSLAALQKQDSVAIYLFAGPVDTRSIKQQEWKKLPLASEPIISEADILAYDFSKHALRLRPEALKRLPRPPVEGTPFVVVVNGERIYPGAFYTMLSSIPCSTPVIVVNRRAQSEAAAEDVVLIERAYPVQSAKEEDLRSDKRVKDALVKLKKLASL
jgi:hypothetical protein